MNHKAEAERIAQEVYPLTGKQFDMVQQAAFVVGYMTAVTKLKEQLEAAEKEAAKHQGDFLDK